MTDPDPDHRAPVLPLRPPVAGGPETQGAVITSIAAHGGSRISTIRRGDGTVFTVTVPPGGMDASMEPGPSAPWIQERDGVHRALTASLDRLAARVGMHLVGGRPPNPSGG